MENNFICPKCKGALNVSKKIIFSTKNSKGELGLVLFSPEVGDYTIEKNDTYIYEQGDQLKFYCPLCKADLTASDMNDSLARISMIDEENKEHHIMFSMIAGEKCTYKISEENVESYGDSRHKYLSFLNLSSIK